MTIMTNRPNKCFISLAIKALEIKKKFELYTSEKEYAKAGNFSDVNNQKSLGNKFSESFNTIHQAPRRTKADFFKKLSSEDSVENFVAKSVLGFIGGIFLTYICFMFLVFSLNFTLKRATYICMGLGVILSLGLAFSVKIRCTVFLCIPQLFSKRGRQALLAYAFILALSGPAKNTLHNVEVMSESLACTQEQLKQAENELLKCVQKPNAAAKKSIEKLLEKICSAVKDFKNFILQLYKNCFDILDTVLQAQKWLYSITFLCQKKVDQPAHVCLNLLAEAIQNCEAVLPLESWKQLCQISPHCKKMICYTKAKSVCPRTGVVDCLPVLKMQKQLDAFKRRAMNILYFKFEAQQTYCQANRSHTYHEEYQGMATEIRQKTDQFLQYFDFMSVIFGIFILVLFVKVVIYRHKFLTEDHYDNRYITSDFVDIDNTRASFHMATILPLEPREKMQYIKVTSVRLVPCERVRLLSSFVFLIFATFKIIIHMLTDSSLYWILSTVRRDERLLYMSSITEEQPVIASRIQGYGLVASLFRNVSRVVRRESSFMRMDPTPCLPDPVPPDWNRYYQILALVIICWLLALWEPYGLRLRHTVMVTYHPDRARERAMWLYNRIISNRISFVKTSRRKLRKKYTDFSTKDTFRYKLLGLCTPKCLLCEATSDSNTSVKCSMPNCPGIYCASCFSILKFCTICRDPAEYGDPSDISEEKDSSEEEVQTKDKRGRVCMLRKVNEDDTEEKKSMRISEISKEQTDLDKDTSALSIFPCTSSHSEDEIAIYESLEPPSTFETRILKQVSFTSDKTSSDEWAGISEKGSVESARMLDGKWKESWKQSCECLPEGKIKDGSSWQKPLCLSSGDEPKPDFNFRKRERAVSLESVTCVQAKGSADISKLRQNPTPPGTSTSSSVKRNAGGLADVQRKGANLKEQDSRSTWECVSLQNVPKTTRRWTRRKVRSSERLPFIDPMNVHEFLPEPDSEDREKDHSEGERVRGSKKKGERGKFLVYEKNKRVSGAKRERDPDVKIFFREETVTILSDDDGQFYSESYHSPNSRTRKPTKKRRNPVKEYGSYSLETDSSFENFLSVKVPTKRKERRKRRRDTASRTGENYPKNSGRERSRILESNHSYGGHAGEVGGFYFRQNSGNSYSSRSYSGSAYSDEELNIIVLGRMESRSDCK